MYLVIMLIKCDLLHNCALGILIKTCLFYCNASVINYDSVFIGEELNWDIVMLNHVSSGRTTALVKFNSLSYIVSLLETFTALSSL